MTHTTTVRISHTRKRKDVVVLGAFAILQAALLGISSPIVTAFVATRYHHSQCHGASMTSLFAGTNESEERTTDISSNTIGMDFEDMGILQNLVVASSLSYLSSEKDQSSNSTSKMEESPYFSQQNLKALVQVVDPKTESGATIFEYQTGDERSIVVACRGSATPINFSTNLRFKLVPLVEENEKGRFLVHEGFQDATNGLWKLLATKLENLKSDYSRIVFTGHSLGAANALLCATNYQRSNQNSDTNPPLSGVVTFGGPRLVNTALAENWNTDLMASVVVKNYVHALDPILRQNGPLWDSLGFGIVGTEIPCEAYQPKAYHTQQEQEEYNKQDLPLAWNILDHCNYLDVFVGPRLF